MKGYNYYKRFCKALEHRGIDPKSKDIDTLIDTVRRRAKSDREVDDVFYPLLRVLEPKSCTMSHCDHSTTYGFCGCYQNKVPGHCKKYREFIKRQDAKAQKVYDEGFEHGKELKTHPESSFTLPEKYKNGYITGRKIGFQKAYWFKLGVGDGSCENNRQTVRV